MIREITDKDFEELMGLYMQLHNISMPIKDSKIMELWGKILKDKDYHVIVAEENRRIAASCTCIIIPNLTHNQQPYALIENVITDINARKKGLATQCLHYAKEIAIEENCYKIMLLTGSTKESTLHFYEQAGYNKKDKTAFIQWI